MEDEKELKRALDYPTLKQFNLYATPSEDRLAEIVHHPSPFWSLASRLVVFSVGMLSKLWMTTLSGKVTVINSEPFIRTLLDKDRTQPLLTITNHTSTVDDPLIWSVLPFRAYLHPWRTMRWSLVAHNICFINKPVANFFLLGQCLPIIRGAGIHQPGMQKAVELLNSGRWVHIFPEGKVNQESKTLLKFKWGVGRLIMESQIPPIVVPIWHKGMDAVMPEGRDYTVPLPGKPITIRFGNPINFAPLLAEWQAGRLDDAQTRIEITRKIFDAMKQLEELATDDHLKVKVQMGAQVTPEDVNMEDGRMGHLKQVVEEVEREKEGSRQKCH